MAAIRRLFFPDRAENFRRLRRSRLWRERYTGGGISLLFNGRERARRKSVGMFSLRAAPRRTTLRVLCVSADRVFARCTRQIRGSRGIPISWDTSPLFLGEPGDNLGSPRFSRGYSACPLFSSVRPCNVCCRVYDLARRSFPPESRRKNTHTPKLPFRVSRFSFQANRTTCVVAFTI